MIKLKDLLKEASFLDNFKKVNSGYNPKKIIADFSKESGTDLADKDDREDHKRYVKDMIAWFAKMDKKGPTVKVGDLVNVNMRTMRRTGIGKIVKAVEMQGSFGFMGQAAPDKQPAWKIDCYTEKNIGTSKKPIDVNGMGMAPIPGIFATGPPKFPVITCCPFFKGSTKRAGAQLAKTRSNAPKIDLIRYMHQR